jgi:hypothetical protein
MTVAQVPTLHQLDDHARHRELAAAFRSRIVRDAAEIRAAKTELRDLQRQGSDLAPRRQSALARRRDDARARLIAYGLHRGIALERMEAGRNSLDQLPYRLPGLIRAAAELAERDALA